ncbi:cold-shock protein [Nocardia halotolerans]|uniref:Cold-shock protein n=1 Tax=Nocardia halotolerans TaxID=1755878 RepID=A0ABV8VJ76_9NOCA
MTTSPAAPIEDHTAVPDPHRHREAEFGSWQPGHVAWFDAEKGFGFLTPDHGDQAVFVEHTAIQAPGYKTLRAGQPVVFTATDTSRGPEAVRVLTYDSTRTAPPSPTPLVHPSTRSWRPRCRRAA